MVLLCRPQHLAICNMLPLGNMYQTNSCRLHFTFTFLLFIWVTCWLLWETIMMLCTYAECCTMQLWQCWNTEQHQLLEAQALIGIETYHLVRSTNRTYIWWNLWVKVCVLNRAVIREAECYFCSFEISCSLRSLRGQTSFNRNNAISKLAWM